MQERAPITISANTRVEERGRSGGLREPVNGWFHFVGAILASVAFVQMTIGVLDRESLRHLIGAAAFGGSAVLMFSASALYHLRRTSPRQALYQRIDHAMIYLFIAGTYTPICLVALWSGVVGRALLVAVWALAALAVSFDLRGRPLSRGQATAVYLALGWAVLPVAPVLVAHPGLGLWLFVGGLFYTGGAILYWRERPRRRIGVVGFHELWHICVLAGSASHFWAIQAYVLPL
jgi:hemolysin III